MPKGSAASGIRKRVSRITKKTGMSTHEAIPVAIKRATAYRGSAPTARGRVEAATLNKMARKQFKRTAK